MSENINLSELRNKNSDNTEGRRIREALTDGGQTVYVYEPTIDNINKIQEIQSDYINEDGEVDIDGGVVMRELIPLLTSISAEGMSDEEIDDVIDNPTMLLLQTAEAIKDIIFQVNKILLLQQKSRLSAMDYELEALTTTKENFEQVVAQAIKETGDSETVGKIVELSDKVQKLQREPNEDNEVNKEAIATYREEARSILGDNDDEVSEKTELNNDSDIIAITDGDEGVNVNSILAEYQQVFADDKED